MKNTRRVLAVNILILAGFFSSLEGALALLIHYPRLIPGFCLSTFRKYCNEWDRNIIQYNPAFARYDSSLYYTLRPGTFVFSNREYDVSFRVNNAGLRDSEQALAHPQVISLGDSFAMGWGVEQDETYTVRVAEKTGLRVLNAGISSYGTAREIALLDRVQTDSLQFLLLQYCRNDFDENISLLTSGRLRISSETSYRMRCLQHMESVRYYPFKHTLKFASLFHSKMFAGKSGYPEEPSGTQEMLAGYATQASVFLRVLEQAGIPSNVHVLVFCLDNYASSPAFTTALKKAWANSSVQPHGMKLSILDVSEVLTAADYYRLDGHLNAKGHEKIAELLGQGLLQEMRDPLLRK